MNFVIFGAPGSGKGTQAELLAKKLEIPTISMGALFRQAYEQKTPDGLKAHSYWGKGNWVPGKLTFKVLKPALDKHYRGFVLDGYPRRIDQVPPLEEYLKEEGEEINWAILLLISDQGAVERLLLRAEKSRETKGKARLDDTKELIQARLNSHHRTVDPIIAYFRDKGILMEVDGERPVEVIHQEIMERLSQ
ncbi:hypothetical protein A2Z41_03745 [Microgenomates group bacterium RBG_19FT_COMBO_39_10]|nr:MAG: hypothetical protein A2Z41_03745 [Microgenomates group bacterium RBG_19FT_COMBO_39_10]